MPKGSGEKVEGVVRKRLDTVSREVLELERKASALARKEISLEERLSAALSRIASDEESVVSGAKTAAMEREKSLEVSARRRGRAIAVDVFPRRHRLEGSDRSLRVGSRRWWQVLLMRYSPL